MINALWLLAIAFALGFGSVPGLLAILCLFVMDGVLELKTIRAHTTTAAEVLAVDPEPLTPARAEAMTTAVMSRVQSELRQAASTRVH